LRNQGYDVLDAIHAQAMNRVLGCAVRSPEAQAVIDANSTNYKSGLRSATSKLSDSVFEWACPHFCVIFAEITPAKNQNARHQNHELQ
jgi:hypothetical protein